MKVQYLLSVCMRVTTHRANDYCLFMNRPHCIEVRDNKIVCLRLICFSLLGVISHASPLQNAFALFETSSTLEN